MKVLSRVNKYVGERKIIEVPKSVRNNFKIGEKVFIVKKHNINELEEVSEVEEYKDAENEEQKETDKNEI